MFFDNLSTNCEYCDLFLKINNDANNLPALGKSKNYEP